MLKILGVVAPLTPASSAAARARITGLELHGKGRDSRRSRQSYGGPAGIRSDRLLTWGTPSPSDRPTASSPPSYTAWDFVGPGSEAKKAPDEDGHTMSGPKFNGHLSLLLACGFVVSACAG